MTIYMDLLLETQQELAVEITQMLDERQATNLQKMVAISIVFVCVFVVSAIIIYAVYSLTDEIQKYSITLAERLVAECARGSVSEAPLWTKFRYVYHWSFMYVIVSDP